MQGAEFIKLAVEQVSLKPLIPHPLMLFVWPSGCDHQYNLIKLGDVKCKMHAQDFTSSIQSILRCVSASMYITIMWS